MNYHPEYFALMAECTAVTRPPQTAPTGPNTTTVLGPTFIPTPLARVETFAPDRIPDILERNGMDSADRIRTLLQNQYKESDSAGLPRLLGQVKHKLDSIPPHLHHSLTKYFIEKYKGKSQ